MTMFSSRTAESFDPKPWRYVFLDSNGQAREAEQVTGGFIFDPRPHFEPTRDPYPWYCNGDISSRSDCPVPGHTPIWQPHASRGARPEPNPILTEFREALKDWGDESPEGNGPRAEAAQRWLHYTVEGNFGFDFTGEHIEHARRVLTRLATLEGDHE